MDKVIFIVIDLRKFYIVKSIANKNEIHQQEDNKTGQGFKRTG